MYVLNAMINTLEFLDRKLFLRRKSLFLAFAIVMEIQSAKLNFMEKLTPRSKTAFGSGSPANSNFIVFVAYQ